MSWRKHESMIGCRQEQEPEENVRWKMRAWLWKQDTKEKQEGDVTKTHTKWGECKSRLRGQGAEEMTCM